MHIRHPWALALSAVTLAVGWSGCVSEPTVAAADAFVLDLVLVDDGQPEDERYAEMGAHCYSAQRTGDKLTVWLWPDEERPSGPWVAVFPTLPEDWSPGFGLEPYKLAMPATPMLRIAGSEQWPGPIEWEPQGDSGTLRVDGEAVALPHRWTVADGAGWHVEARLMRWTGDLVVDRHTGLCD